MMFPFGIKYSGGTSPLPVVLDGIDQPVQTSLGLAPEREEKTTNSSVHNSYLPFIYRVL